MRRARRSRPSSTASRHCSPRLPRTPYPQLESRAHAAFFHALGQQSVPIGSGRILSYYASTVATDVVGASLAREGKRVALVNPIIDCIPAILRHRGLELVPVERAASGRPGSAGRPGRARRRDHGQPEQPDGRPARGARRSGGWPTHVPTAARSS